MSSTRTRARSRSKPTARVRTTRRAQRDRTVCEEAIRNLENAFALTLTTIQVHHWEEDVYDHHNITDALYETLREHADKFIEVLKGKSLPSPTVSSASSWCKRVETSASQAVWTNLLVYARNPGADTIQTVLFNFREFLDSLSQIFRDPRDANLLSVRDDMLNEVNRALYLLVMK